MGAIPVSPSSIANAGQYSAPTIATPIALCTPPAEGTKCIPMQFVFNVHASWLVNLGAGSPNPPLSQICGLFVDTTNSTRDVTILFPDTGYTVRVEQGGGRMIPAITGKNISPLFYVILDSSGALTSDVVNVIALNQFVPEFSSNEVQKVLSYGYGSMFSLQPSFAQSTTFSTNMNGLAGTTTLINNTQWYITGLNIIGILTSAVGSPVGTILELFDGANLLLQYAAASNGTANYIPQLITDVGGLNIESSGTGPLTAKLTSTSGLTGATFTVNINGGVLIT